MPWFRVALFGVGILLTGYIAVGLLPDILEAITREQGGGQRGYAEGVFAWGLSAAFCGSLVHRLRTVGPTFPILEVGIAAALDAFARGWGIGVTVLSARVLGEALRHFGAPPLNGSYLADAFFFVIVTLILCTPGLFAAVLAKWMR